MYATFNSFEIEMTKKQARVCSHSGSCDSDVMALSELPKIKRQLDKIDPEFIAAELEGYGAWDEIELQDHAQNRRRILWIAAGNIAEEC
jgi:hypothetical protein